MNAVKAALRLYDEKGEGQLLQGLMDAVGATSFDDFIVKLNSDAPADYAALFPVVQENADRGELLAVRVLEMAGMELVRLTETVLRRLSGHSAADGDVSIATHGGVLANSHQARESLERTLQHNFPEVRFLQRPIDPARGALNRARRNSRSS
jgi:N-acetylglucosamine kinase-like BadF-type ATPase